MPTTAQRVAAEFVGTFFLVFAGCGAAVLSAGYVTGAGVHLGIDKFQRGAVRSKPHVLVHGI